jgi:two-component system CheB/CheR fusion protein
MHLVSCRNLLIYFAPATQRAVLAMFHFALRGDGFLLLGPSESPSSLADELVAIDDHWRLFHKRPGLPPVTAAAGVGVTVRLPDTQAEPGRVARSRPARHGDLRRLDARRPLVTLRGAGDDGDDEPDARTLAAYDQLLDLFMPPGFLVGEDRALLDSFAGAERLLRAPPRRPSGNLLELLDEELRLVVAAALRRAFDDSVQVAYSGVAIELDGPARATVIARALAPGPTRARTAIVTFQDLVRGAPAASPPAAPRAPALVDAAPLAAPVPTAAHEQLIAAYEELHSVNDQLHSLNDQLQTAAHDYQRQRDELHGLTSDLYRLLDTGGIAALAVDRALHVRAFTSHIAPTFRLQPADLGRPLGDFASTLDRPQLLDDLASAIASGQPAALTVRDASGAELELAIAPHGDGAILSLRPAEPAAP